MIDFAAKTVAAAWQCSPSRRWYAWTLIVLNLGCMYRPPIDTEYGRREASSHGGSVNGTFVFSEMFADADFEVSTTRFLGRLVRRADVVVWFPDEFSVPDGPIRNFFEDWLIEQPNRTLIYVAREFDAEAAYWHQLANRSEQPASEIEYRHLEAMARASYDAMISELPNTDECPWFSIDRAIPPRRANKFTGSWSDGLDAAMTDIWISSRILTPDRYDTDISLWRTEPLLSSGEDVIAAEISRTLWNRSRLIVVNNGSWLLNMSLVNHQHRQLAGRLVKSCGSGRRVVFVESGVGGPPITAKQPLRHHGLETFVAWPINVVLIHVTVLGMLYCFSVFPIFGREIRLPTRDKSDFGRHITALGELLERVGDESFARAQIAQFQQLTGEVPARLAATTRSNPSARTSPPNESAAAAETSIASVTPTESNPPSPPSAA